MRSWNWFFKCLAVVACLLTGNMAASAENGERACFPPPAGLTGWWPGDGNTLDIIGGRNAVLHGDATTGQGFVGQAFVLDGNGDFVDISDDPALNAGTGDFTVDLWVLFNDTAGEQVLVEKWIQRFDDPNTSEGWTLTKLADDRLELSTHDARGADASIATDCPSRNCAGPLAIPTGTWIHFAATRASGQLTLFMNGVPVGEGVFESSPNLNSTSSLKFGHRGNFNDTPGSESDQEFYLNGLVDEVQVFVGRALPRGLIRAIYKAGNSGECKD